MSSRERLVRAAADLGWAASLEKNLALRLSPPTGPLRIEVFFAQFGGKVRSARLITPDGRIASRDRITGGVPGIIAIMKEMSK